MCTWLVGCDIGISIAFMEFPRSPKSIAYSKSEEGGKDAVRWGSESIDCVGVTPTSGVGSRACLLSGLGEIFLRHLINEEL